MNRIVEDTIIAREATTQLLFRLISRMYDSRVTGDCLAHLAEMKADPTYVPFGLTVEHMFNLTSGKRDD